MSLAGQVALAKRHSMTGEAIEVGQRARAYRTILTHFSQRYPKIPAIGPSFTASTCIAFDLLSVNLAGWGPDSHSLAIAGTCACVWYASCRGGRFWMSAGLPFQLKNWNHAAAAHAQALLLLHMLKGFLTITVL